jgi:hypothetical protein
MDTALADSVLAAPGSESAVDRRLLLADIAGAWLTTAVTLAAIQLMHAIIGRLGWPF